MSNLQQQRNDVTHIDGNLHQNADARIGIVVGRFNGFVLSNLTVAFVPTAEAGPALLGALSCFNGLLYLNCLQVTPHLFS